MSKISDHLWKTSSKHLKQFPNKKPTKSCGFTWGKTANSFDFLYAKFLYN